MGSGEALNEQILGDPWPEADERLEMLEDAVEVIRLLWSGDSVPAATAHRLWPIEQLPGELAQIPPTPPHFERASSLVSEDMVADAVPCGPDLDRHRQAIQEFADAGVDELYIQQIGGGHAEFFDVYSRDVLPRFG